MGPEVATLVSVDSVSLMGDTLRQGIPLGNRIKVLELDFVRGQEIECRVRLRVYRSWGRLYKVTQNVSVCGFRRKLARRRRTAFGKAVAAEPNELVTGSSVLGGEEE